MESNPDSTTTATEPTNVVWEWRHPRDDELRAAYIRGLKLGLIYSVGLGLIGAAFQASDAGAGQRIGTGIVLALIGAAIFVGPWVGYWLYSGGMRIWATADGHLHVTRCTFNGAVDLAWADTAEVVESRGRGNMEAATTVTTTWRTTHLNVWCWRDDPAAHSPRHSPIGGEMRLGIYNYMTMLFPGVGHYVMPERERLALQTEIQGQIDRFSNGKPDWID